MGNKIGCETLIFERVIDGEDGIWLGVNGNHVQNNPMSKQKLHIQGESFKNLKFFTKSDSNLTYEFDDNITLRFYKNQEGVYYNLNYPAKKINKTKLMH